MAISRFFDKTRNNWGEREDFEKVKGKYDLVAIDYSGGVRIIWKSLALTANLNYHPNF